MLPTLSLEVYWYEGEFASGATLPGDILGLSEQSRHIWPPLLLPHHVTPTHQHAAYLDTGVHAGTLVVVSTTTQSITLKLSHVLTVCRPGVQDGLRWEVPTWNPSSGFYQTPARAPVFTQTPCSKVTGLAGRQCSLLARSSAEPAHQSPRVPVHAASLLRGDIPRGMSKQQVFRETKTKLQDVFLSVLGGHTASSTAQVSR